MAKLIRRHWKLAIVNVVLLLSLGVGLTLYLSIAPSPAVATTAAGAGGAAEASGSSAPASHTANELDPLTYSHVQELRERSCLTSFDLASAGCDQAQAEKVFATLLTWCQQNHAAWNAAEQAELVAQRDLDEATRQINVGPRDEMLLARFPQIQGALTTARQNRRQLIEPALQSATSLLAPAQNEILANARANSSVPLRYRYASNLTAEQTKALEVASYKERQSAAESSMLGQVQKSAIETAAANQRRSMEGVLAAEHKVLPLPKEMSNAVAIEASPQGSAQ